MRENNSPSTVRFTLEQARQMIQQDPNSFQGHLILGELLYHSKEFVEAIGSFKRGVELLQNDLDNQPEGSSHLGVYPMHSIKNLYLDSSLMYGDCLIKSELHKDACDVLQQGLSMDDTSADGWNLLAIAQANRGKISWAAHSFRKAVLHNPSRKDLWSNLHISYQNLGRPEAERIQQVLDGGRNLEEDLLVLIDLLIGGGDYVSARTVIDMLKDNRGLLQFSRLHIIEGEYKEAEKSLKKMVKSDKNNLDGHWHLARVLAIQGKEKDALKRVDEILKISSDHANALILRELLQSSEGKGRVKFGVFTHEEMETEPDDERTIHQYKVRPELFLPIGSTVEDAVHFLHRGEFFRFSDKKNMKYALMMIFQKTGSMSISCNALPAPVGKTALGIHEYIGTEPSSFLISKHEPTSEQTSFSSLLVPNGVYSLIPSTLHSLQRAVVLSLYAMLVKREVEQQLAHWSYD